MKLMTVTGPVEETALGRVLVHEHVRIAFAGWELDRNPHMDREEEISIAVDRMRQLQDHGVGTFVDPATVEIGRDVELLRRIAEESGMHVVAATGFYHESDGIGLPYYWRVRWPEEVAEFFLGEIENGVGDTGIRPGVIKAATSDPWGRHESKILEAAASAGRQSGLAIITHTTHSVGAREQMEAFEQAGMDPGRCLIGHQDEQEDYGILTDIVKRGFFVGFDRIGIARMTPDERRADKIASLVADGYVRQICLSQDHMCYDLHPRPSYWVPKDRAEKFYAETKPQVDAELFGRPHTYLFDDFLPLLSERGVPDTDITTMLVDNPRRLLCGS